MVMNKMVFLIKNAAIEKKHLFLLLQSHFITNRQKHFPKSIEDFNVRFAENIKTKNVNCLHKTCTDCQGSGKKKDGQVCIHYISCPCNKCSPFTY